MKAMCGGIASASSGTIYVDKYYFAPIHNCVSSSVTLFKVGNTQQHKKEAIDNGARSKLNRHLVLMITRICRFLAIEVEWWLNQKSCSYSTNAENVDAQNGGGI